MNGPQRTACLAKRYTQKSQKYMDNTRSNGTTASSKFPATHRKQNRAEMKSQGGQQKQQE